MFKKFSEWLNSIFQWAFLLNSNSDRRNESPSNLKPDNVREPPVSVKKDTKVSFTNKSIGKSTDDLYEKLSKSSVKKSAKKKSQPRKEGGNNTNKTKKQTKKSRKPNKKIETKK